VKSLKLFLSILSLFVLVTFPLISSVGASSVMWSQTYGGGAIDSAEDIVQTSDGGYAIAGWTGSIDDSDFWLIKIDSFGNMEWNRTYGEEGMSYASSLIKTSDGGFALGGEAFSEDGQFDFGMVKTDKDGDVEWTKTYGGEKWDRASSLVETSDGGFALAGRTNSFGSGAYDFWLVRTDANGNMQWNKTYGGSDWDEAYSLVETSDGGFALAGETTVGAGNYDSWLVKTDGTGNMEWNQTYGGTENDRANSLVETSDGGYALAGRTKSFGAGEYDDLWLVKTDECGIIPEFPSWAPMLLVLTVLASSIIIYKRRLLKTPIHHS